MKLKWIIILFICAWGFLIYSNTFKSSFHYDDYHAIVDNEVVKDLPGLISFQELNPRYVGTLSFALNYHFGGLNVTGYHIVNTIIHILNAILVYLITTSTLSRQEGENRNGKANLFLAAFAAFLFLSHPLATQSVTYIVQRRTSLCTLFFLLALFSYIKAVRSAQSMKISHSPVDLRWYGITLISTILAMLTKEMAITLPVVIMLYHYYFLRDYPIDIRHRIIILIPLLLTMLIIPITIFPYNPTEELSTVEQFEEVTSWGQEAVFTRWEYFLTQSSIILKTYLRLLIIPVGQNIDHSCQVARSLGEPGTLLTLTTLSLIFTAAVKLYGRARLFSFGILWFFITISVTSSIIPNPELVQEQRVYLPMVGFVFAIAGFASNPCRKGEIPKPILFTGIGIILILSTLTYERNKVWRDEISLWSDCLKKTRYRARPHDILGTAYLKKGDYQRAIEHYLIALRIQPQWENVYNNLANVYIRSNRAEKAVPILWKAIEINPDYAKAHNNLGFAYLQMGKIREAVEEFKIALSLSPSYAEAHNNLGNAYLESGKLAEAQAEFETALKLKPDYALAYSNLGLIYANRGEHKTAIDYCRKAALIAPQDGEVFYLLANVYEHAGKYKEAIDNYLKSLSLNPKSAKNYNNLGIVYAKQSQYEKAIEAWEKALELQPNLKEAQENLARIKRQFFLDKD